MNRTFILVALTVALAAFSAGGATQAEIATYGFSGIVSDTTGALFALPAGERYHGYFVYDTSGAVTSSNPNVGFYLNSLQRFSVDGTALNPFAARIDNRDPGSQDSLELYGGPNFNDVRLTLVDSSGTVFSSFGLPSSLNLNNFDIRSISKSPPGGSGAVHNFGTIDTLTRLPQPPALNPVSTFTTESTFLQQAPIVHTSTFENLTFGDLGNPLPFEGLTYSTQFADGTPVGTFIPVAPSPAGQLSLANNSLGRMSIGFGEQHFVNNFGLALKPSFNAAGSWKIVLTLIDGGMKVETVPYAADLASRYRGFSSTVGISSVDIYTIGTSNMSIDQVSYSVIVPEPSSLILAGFGIAGFAAWSWRRRT